MGTDCKAGAEPPPHPLRRKVTKMAQEPEPLSRLAVAAMASTFKVGTRVRHKYDGCEGSVVAWHAKSKHADVKFDDGETLPMYPEVLQVWRDAV